MAVAESSGSGPSFGVRDVAAPQYAGTAKRTRTVATIRVVGAQDLSVGGVPLTHARPPPSPQLEIDHQPIVVGTGDRNHLSVERADSFRENMIDTQ